MEEEGEARGKKNKKQTALIFHAKCFTVQSCNTADKTGQMWVFGCAREDRWDPMQAMENTPAIIAQLVKNIQFIVSA